MVISKTSYLKQLFLKDAAEKYKFYQMLFRMDKVTFSHIFIKTAGFHLIVIGVYRMSLYKKERTLV